MGLKITLFSQPGLLHFTEKAETPVGVCRTVHRSAPAQAANLKTDQREVFVTSCLDFYLPPSEARLAQEMSTGLNPNVFIPLCTDLTQLESASDLTVQLVLLLLVVGSLKG